MNRRDGRQVLNDGTRHATPRQPSLSDSSSRQWFGSGEPPRNRTENPQIKRTKRGWSAWVHL